MTSQEVTLPIDGSSGFYFIENTGEDNMIVCDTTRRLTVVVKPGETKSFRMISNQWREVPLRMMWFWKGLIKIKRWMAR